MDADTLCTDVVLLKAVRFSANGWSPLTCEKEEDSECASKHSRCAAGDIRVSKECVLFAVHNEAKA